VCRPCVHVFVNKTVVLGIIRAGLKNGFFGSVSAEKKSAKFGEYFFFLRRGRDGNSFSIFFRKKPLLPRIFT